MAATNTVVRYGRLIPHPGSGKKTADYLDENISTQDQIENLKVKISLKERYNKVLAEEMEESNLGTSKLINELYLETKTLRYQLANALNAEREAVYNAMRTHRRFQLATKKMMPCEAIPWLDDKLFDMSKKLNLLLYQLYCKRKNFEKMEAQVMEMEHWQRAGNSPFESDSELSIQKVESDIENMKVKLETASILNSKYVEIKQILWEESGKYEPVIKTLGFQLEMQRKELKQLEKMATEAEGFATEAQRRLRLTEQEAHENRQKRKVQMAKMKKAVQKLLENSQLTRRPSVTGMELGRHRSSVFPAETSNPRMDDIESKLKTVEVLEDRINRVMSAMRVKTSAEIIVRYQSVMTLDQRFSVEIAQRESDRDDLLRQKDHLNLILCHLKFNGSQQDQGLKTRIESLRSKTDNVETETHVVKSKMAFHGAAVQEARFGIFALIDKLEPVGHRRKAVKKAGLAVQMKFVLVRLNELKDSVQSIRSKLPAEDAAAENKVNYKLYVKPEPLSSKALRVELERPVDDDDSDEDEMTEDLRIPLREDIKLKSDAVITQAKLRKGETP